MGGVYWDSSQVSNRLLLLKYLSHVPELSSGGVALVVLDDVWHESQIEDVVMLTKIASSVNVRLLISTRQESLLGSLRIPGIHHIHQHHTYQHHIHIITPHTHTHTHTS